VWNCCEMGYEVRWRVVVLARSVVWRMRVRRCWAPEGILGPLVVE
jgi:hypothetical protein